MQSTFWCLFSTKGDLLVIIRHLYSETLKRRNDVDLTSAQKCPLADLSGQWLRISGDPASCSYLLYWSANQPILLVKPYVHV